MKNRIPMTCDSCGAPHKPWTLELCGEIFLICQCPPCFGKALNEAAQRTLREAFKAIDPADWWKRGELPPEWKP